MNGQDRESEADFPLRVVLVTFPDEETARKLSRHLVESNLAACVNLVPGIRSIYRWEGKVEEGIEVLGIIKTTAQTLPALEANFVQEHPYEVPEFVVLEPISALSTYLQWVMKNASPDASFPP